MHKPRSHLARLPEIVRDEINRRLRDGWCYDTIVHWLFTKTTPVDIPDLNLKPGDSYSLVWMRPSKSREKAEQLCSRALGVWFHTHYPLWLTEQANRNQSIRLIEHIEQLTSVASDKGQPGSTTGGNLLVRSMLIDALEHLKKSDKRPADIARLAHAWARVNESGVRVQDSLDAALQMLRDEIKRSPEALALFNQLHHTVKHSKKRRT